MYAVPCVSTITLFSKCNKVSQKQIGLSRLRRLWPSLSILTYWSKTARYLLYLYTELSIIYYLHTELCMTIYYSTRAEETSFSSYVTEIFNFWVLVVQSTSKVLLFLCMNFYENNMIQYVQKNASMRYYAYMGAWNIPICIDQTFMKCTQCGFLY